MRLADERWRKLVVPLGARYGILGGTFDPPHLGHLVLAQEVHTRLALDTVWFVPAAQPPHKTGKVVSPVDDRVAMVQRAIVDDHRFGLCPIELSRSGPSYTVDTLGALRERWGPAAEIVLILGWDMLAYLPQWHEAVELVRRANRIAAAHRPGFDARSGELAAVEAALPGLREKLVLMPVPQVDISSTLVRTRVASSLPIRYLVPDAVAEYVTARGLYAYVEASGHGAVMAEPQPEGKDEA